MWKSASDILSHLGGHSGVSAATVMAAALTPDPRFRSPTAAGPLFDDEPLANIGRRSAVGDKRLRWLHKHKWEMIQPNLLPAVVEARVPCLKNGNDWWAPDWVKKIGYDVPRLKRARRDPDEREFILAEVALDRAQLDNKARQKTAPEGSWRVEQVRGSAPRDMSALMASAMPTGDDDDVA